MNKIPGLSAALAATAGALAVAPSAAAPITLSHSVTLSSLLQQGQSTNLSFDIQAFLTPQGHSAAQVIGGEVSVFGFSDASYVASGSSADYNLQTVGNGSHLHTYSYIAYYSYSYSCGSWWSRRTCYGGGSYTAYSTQTIDDYARYADRDMYQVDAVADQMRLTLGDTVLTDTADTLSQSAGNFGAYLYDGYVNSAGCSDTGCSRTSLYHRERNVYSALSGALTLTAGLDPRALLDLQDDGMLGLSIGAPLGHVALQSVSFTLLLQEPVLLPMAAPSAGTAVPEPAGLALTGIALAAALAAGGRRLRRGSPGAASTPPGGVNEGEHVPAGPDARA